MTSEFIIFYDSMDKQFLINKGPNNKYLKEYKLSLISLSVIQMEAAIGLMLGDASIQTQNNGKSYRMKFEYSIKSKEYAEHVYNIFDE